VTGVRVLSVFWTDSEQEGQTLRAPARGHPGNGPVLGWQSQQPRARMRVARVVEPWECAMATKNGGPVTKMEAVRQVLAEMGKDAKPAEMQPVIKEKFGIEMSTDHISTYKGDILKKAKAKGGNKPAPAPVSRTASVTGSGGIRFEDVRATKELVDRLGADRLRALIALFAK
jgi:hypothetical protein